MVALFKALFPGVLLTWIVSYIMGSNGTRGGFLNIHRISVADFDIHWSWPLFIVGTGLFAVIFKSME